jgi:hypothetical protein
MPNEHRSRISAEDRERLGETGYKRALAYERLGVDPKDVQQLPYFRGQLRRIARHVNLGVQPEDQSAAFDLLQSSEDDEARKVWNAYNSVPESYRRLLPAEAFCHAAGVSPARVLEAIAAVAVRQGAQASAIIASVMHPRVVSKTIERALQDDGVKDRMALHRATGFLPSSGLRR